MRSNDTQVPRGAAAALDQESPRSFWKGLWSGRFYTWNPQTAVIDPWPPAVFRFCTRREVRGCMLGVVWDGMNSLCTAIERDIPRVSVWLRRDSRLKTLQTPLLQSFTAPLVGPASVRYDTLLASGPRPLGTARAQRRGS